MIHSIIKKYASVTAILSLLIAGGAFAVTLEQDASTKPSQTIVIGTASETGVYYPAGGAICALLKREARDHGIRCLVEPTDGSIQNLDLIRSGKLDFGVVQSDWQYHAYNGTARFERVGPDLGLRSVFSLYSEPFTVLVRKDSGIKTFDDLKGKRVNIGDPGSGMRATMEILMQAKGWNMGSFGRVYEMRANEQGEALCKGDIDAMVYAAGHPNGTIQEVTSNCDAMLIPVEGPLVDSLIEKFPFYAHATIPGSMYKGNPNSVNTFGVKATFLTNERVSEEVVYQLVKAVVGHINYFKARHPVFSFLDPAHMIADGNTAPLHLGAERYYREVGMLKP